jgi:hypothetical protein
MTFNNTLRSLALGAVLSIAATGAHSAEPWSPQSMKPLHAVSLDAGSKHVVSYFLSTERQCKLTLMISNRPSNGDATPEPAARVQVAIDAGKIARVDSTEGKTLEFACRADAQGMTAAAIERTALFGASE